MKTRRRGSVGWLSVVATAALVVGVLPTTQAAPGPTPEVGAGRTYRKPPLAAVPDGIAITARLRAAAEAAPDAASTAGGAELRKKPSKLSLESCADDPAFLCGTLPVPLDRRNPDGRTVNLHVEVFPHTGSKPKPKGAVFVTEGGPGFSVSQYAKYGYAFFLLAETAETRDLVFVDQRGVGLSDVIECPAWQHDSAPFYQAARQCHDQLGDTADLYSTTDVADDLEDVRKALGYGKIDLVGGSYAGTDMLTYTVRHKNKVRSVALGAPAVTVDTDPFNSYVPIAYPDLVDKLCGRSPGCAGANPDPDGSLAWLAARLRRNPVTGTGIDSEGVPHQVTVTENLLANAIMYYQGASFVGPGEITQAAEALRDGDTVPLLRLAADVDPADGFDSGDPREFSNGHALARVCVDLPLQWDKDAAPPKRAAQYAAAYAKEPSRYGPISRAAWAAPGYLGFSPWPCISSRWEDRPNYPSGTKVRGVPALVLGGEYDIQLPESLAQLATDVLVDADYVSMTAAGHVPWWYSDCGPELVQRFIATRRAGDTSCAGEPPAGWWMPGSFPTTVADAPRATQTSGPTAPARIRRLATVVAWTVMDGLQHNYSVPVPVSASLRGGTVTFDREAEVPTLAFDQARFTTDVAVSGSLVWADVFDGEFSVQGPGAQTTTAQIDGVFLTPGEDLTITLEVAGQPATFAVPGY